MSDAATFLGSYRETLREEVAGGSWPAELVQIYVPESCLKHSGTKEVYLVIDKRTGARVVLRASNLDAGERADAEYTILSRLNYPGIPKTYGTLVKDGRSYIAREYFDGEPLDLVIARGVMQRSQIEHIARQVCAILSYLHAQNPPVIHRDIKPQNIILRPDGSIGLTDFGIARTFKEGSVSDTQYMGTLYYAPPEQYGYSQSSPQTDIYALGIVLIYLATGSPDRRELSKRITHAPLRQLIEKCIAFDPKSRFQNARQVVKRIDSFKTRRLRIGALIAGGCLALTLIGVGVWQLVPLISNLLSPTLTAWTPPEQTRVEDRSFLTELSNADYSESNDPRIGSTNWLFDYNNDGNTPGNTSNGAFAVENGANLGDYSYVASNDSIYRINNTDGSLESQVYSGTVSGSLNVYNDELFFSGPGTVIHALDLETGVVRALEGIACGDIFFDNGRLYYTDPYDGLNLYTVKTDGTDPQLVSSGTERYYTNIVDGVRYYSDGTDGDRIYAHELSTGKTVLVYDKPATWLSVCNGRIYFSDQNAAVLASIKLDGSDYQVVYGEPSYYINATPHGVFAIDAITKDLVVISGSGGASKVLMEDCEDNICVAGGWVFYRNWAGKTVVGMVRENGSDASAFAPE